jgi:hypothetical protein
MRTLVLGWGEGETQVIYGSLFGPGFGARPSWPSPDPGVTPILVRIGAPTRLVHRPVPLGRDGAETRAPRNGSAEHPANADVLSQAANQGGSWKLVHLAVSADGASSKISELTSPVGTVKQLFPVSLVPLGTLAPGTSLGKGGQLEL